MNAAPKTMPAILPAGRAKLVEELGAVPRVDVAGHVLFGQIVATSDRDLLHLEARVLQGLHGALACVWASQAATAISVLSISVPFEDQYLLSTLHLWTEPVSGGLQRHHVSLQP
jgi:hypothetical protein